MRITTILSGLLLVAAGVPATPADTATGIVFSDLNDNAAHDAGEPGIPDVCVSNGFDVVRTDAHGRYRLPVNDDTVLFVVKPRGWMTPVDQTSLPRFYYVHKPAGSPKLKYDAVPPTGPLPASIDFALYKRPEPDRFKVILFGDTQPYSIGEIDYLAHDIIEPLIGTDAVFGMTLGDIVGDYLNLHAPLNRTVAHVGIPWYNVIGNHDMDYAAADDTHSDDHFEHVYGPPYYSFDYGNAHFVVLDSIIWHGKTEDRKGYYKGGLGERQLAWLRNDLKEVPEDRLVVVTMHIPMIEFGERKALYELLASQPHCVSFSAHWHVQEQWFLDGADDWPGKKPHHHTTLVTTSGSWWKGAPDEVGIPHTMMRDGAPNGWMELTIDGTDYQMHYQVARRPRDYQMNIHTPEVVPAGKTADAMVRVNVFNGNERSVVEMRVAGDAWRPMAKISEIDPYYQALKDAEESDNPPRGSKLPGTRASAHLWAGSLPAGLEAGSHLIEVRTTDMFGQTYTGRRIIRVE